MAVYIVQQPCCPLAHPRHTFQIVHPVNPHLVTTIVCEGLTVEEVIKL